MPIKLSQENELVLDKTKIIRMHGMANVLPLEQTINGSLVIEI